MFRNGSGAKVATGPGGGCNALVRAIFARDVAQVAADALLLIDSGYDFVIQIEIAPVSDSADRLTHQVDCRSEAFLVEILVQPVDHVFHNAKAIVHGS